MKHEIKQRNHFDTVEVRLCTIQFDIHRNELMMRSGNSN